VDAFNQWAKICNIKFIQDKTNPMKAKIRISFLEEGTAWSYVGTDILNTRFVKLGEPTMNFGWELARQPETAAHEIGHTLGFPHEHQSPKAGIVWNLDALYKSLGSPPNNWDKATVDSNIVNKLSGVTGSDWDPSSVMEYPFEAAVIKSPAPYNKTGIAEPKGISEIDKKMALSFYPFPVVTPDSPTQPTPSTTVYVSPTLESFQSCKFVIQAKETAAVTFRLAAKETVKLRVEPANFAIRLVAKKQDFSHVVITSQDTNYIERDLAAGEYLVEAYALNSVAGNLIVSRS
jgi:hypothetical protein